jgi:hypothetical protein
VIAQRGRRLNVEKFIPLPLPFLWSHDQRGSKLCASR